MDTVRICKSWWDRQELAQTKLRVNQGSKKDYQQSDNPLLSLLKTHGSRDFLVVAVNRLSVYSQFFLWRYASFRGESGLGDVAPMVR
jgi:hypothetical protein